MSAAAALMLSGAVIAAPAALATPDPNVPPATDGYAVYSAPQLSVACTSGVITGMTFSFDYDASHLNTSYDVIFGGYTQAAAGATGNTVTGGTVRIDAGQTGSYSYTFTTNDPTASTAVGGVFATSGFGYAGAEGTCANPTTPAYVAPAASLSTVDCSGNVTLTVDGTNSNSDWSWISFPPGGRSIAAQQPDLHGTIVTQTLTGLSPGDTIGLEFGGAEVALYADEFTVQNGCTPPPPAAAPAFTSDTPAATGTVGDSYGPYTFTASGTSAPTFAVVDGALPDGLSLDANTGVLSGTPTKSGKFTFTVAATNSGGSVTSDSITITIGARFPDVPASNPFAAAIDGLAQQGVIEGYPDGTFQPGQPLTRQSAAVLMARLLLVETGSGKCAAGHNQFSDVANGSPFCAAINALVGDNIINGYAGGRYQPGAAITRQAIAAFVERADSWLAHGKDASKVSDADCPAHPSFDDVTTTNPFCGDIEFLANNHIANGYPNGAFGPLLPTTRRAGAAILFRFGNRQS